MKPVIVAEKPSQAKAYADAFKTKKQKGYYEILPDPLFPQGCLLYTSPSPRDRQKSRMPSSA